MCYGSRQICRLAEIGLRKYLKIINDTKHSDRTELKPKLPKAGKDSFFLPVPQCFTAKFEYENFVEAYESLDLQKWAHRI